jgi:hypothetical protein
VAKPGTVGPGACPDQETPPWSGGCSTMRWPSCPSSTARWIVVTNALVPWGGRTPGGRPRVGCCLTAISHGLFSRGAAFPRLGARVRLLYEEHAAPLWRYAARLTVDRARAEDVVHETLLCAWQHAQVTDDSERSVRAWLFTVARNLIVGREFSGSRPGGQHGS